MGGFESFCLNLSFSDIFSKDIETEAGKIVRTRQIVAVVPPAENLVISIDRTYPSAVYIRFQEIQHMNSMYPHQMTREAVVPLLDQLIECHTHSQFTSSTVRFIIVALHQFVIMLIARREDVVNEDLLEKVLIFYNTVKKNGKLVCVSTILACYVLHPLSISSDPTCLIPDQVDNDMDTDKEAHCEEHRERTRTSKPVTTKYVFSGHTMILPRLLMAHFDPANESSFLLLSDYLLLLLDDNFITLDTLNENLMVLLRYDDWSAAKYKQLSQLMRIVAARRDDDKTASAGGGDNKEHLLLSVLSELTANIDDFSCE